MRNKTVNEYSFEPMPLNYVFTAHSMNYHYLLLVAFLVAFSFWKRSSWLRDLWLKTVALTDYLETVHVAFSLVLLWKHESGIKKDGKGSEGWLDVTSAIAGLTWSLVTVPALSPYPRRDLDQTSPAFWLFSGPRTQCDSSLKEQMVELVKKTLSSSSSSWPRCQSEMTKNFLLGCNWTWLDRCHISKARACQRLIKCCLCL